MFLRNVCSGNLITFKIKMYLFVGNTEFQREGEKERQILLHSPNGCKRVGPVLNQEPGVFPRSPMKS